MEKEKTAKMPQIKQSKFDEMFTLIKDKDGVKIAMGNFQVSKKVFDKFSDAERYIAQKPYEILINVTCLFVNILNKENKNNEKTI